MSARSSLSRLGALGMAVACLALAASRPACAAETDDAPVAFENAAVMDAPELQAVRGGYVTVGGLTFDFGAEVKTYVDGALVLDSTLTWTPQGAQTMQTVSGGATTVVDGAAAAKALGVDLGGASGPAALVGGSSGGQTVVLQQLTPSRIASVVLNTGDNRNIRQDTILTLTIPGLQAMQQGMSMRTLGSALADQASAAFRISSPH